MRIRVLGPLLVDECDALSPRDQVVLEALVADAERPLAADQLADAMWGEHRPASWPKLIPSSVFRIRKLLGGAAIETTPQGYRLTLGGDAVDAVRFERLVDRGHQLLVVGEADRARHVLREALALWRGRPLAGVEDWEPGRAAADRLDETRREAEEAVIEAGLRAGTPTEVVAEARLRVAQEPLRERRWSLLALAQYLSGDAAAALATLRQARARLADELGLDPGPDLEELEHAMLRRDPSLAMRVALPELAPRSPYPGLRAFDVDEGEFFFGRDTDVRQCLERLAESACLVVVGPSGCGKSSLLRAGVVAALRRDDAQVFMLGPGGDSAAAVLELAGSGFVGTLVIDQLDEILAACGADERRELVSALVGHSPSWGLAVTIREDRLADIADVPALARLLERGTYLLGPMTEDGMRDAIVRPAAEAALVLEPGLVDVLVKEVTGSPGALPLMAHALQQTWERREGRTLTVDGYHASGGISGAVAQTAEEVYEDLSVAGRDALRDLLKRLIAVAPDGAPMRVWAPVQQLGAGPGEDLVEVLVRARLLTRDNGVVAVAHESLARFWPRLQGWLEDDIEGRRILRHLTDAAESWDALARVDSELYRGVRLSRALEWSASSGITLTPLESEFLEASRRHADDEVRRQALAERRQRRQAWRVRGLLAMCGVLVLVVTAAGTFGLRQRDLAADASVASHVNAVLAVASAASDPVVAALAGVEAVRLRDDAESRAALHRALERWPALLASVEVPGAVSLSVGADGTVLLGHTEKLTVHDPRSLAEVSAVDGVAPAPTPRIQLLAGGREVLLGTADSEVFLVNRSTGSRESLLPFAPGDIARVAASADGRVRAAEHFDWRKGRSTVHVWRGTVPVRTLPGLALAGFALTPDGSRVLLRHRSSPALSVVDVRSGRRLAARTPAELGMSGDLGIESQAPMAVSPDGRLVAVGDGAEVVVLDARSLEVRWRADNPSGSVLSLGFSPDGTVLVGGDDAGSVTVWTAGGRVREGLDGPTRPVVGLGFSPDGAVLYTLTFDGRLSTWDLRGDRRPVQLVRPPTVDTTDVLAGPSPDGVALAVTEPVTEGRSGPLSVVDLAAGTTVRLPAASRNDGIVAWQPGGTGRLATFDADMVRVWDWRRGRQVVERSLGIEISTIAYTPDGREIVVGEGDGSVYRVDAETLRPVGARTRVDDAVTDLEWVAEDRVLALVHTGLYRVVDLAGGARGEPHLTGMGVTHADVSPDGRVVALGGDGGEVGLAVVDTGEWLIEPRSVHSGPVTGVEFSPDGSVLVTSADDGPIRLWDGRTGVDRGSLRAVPPGVASFVTALEDGHALMIGGSDGSVRRWDLRTETWIRQACARAGRNLASEEWLDIFGEGRPYRRTCPDVSTPR